MGFKFTIDLDEIYATVRDFGQSWHSKIGVPRDVQIKSPEL